MAAFNCSQLRIVWPMPLQWLQASRSILFMTLGSLLSHNRLIQSVRLSCWLVFRALLIRYCRRNLLFASRPDSVKLFNPLLPFSSMSSALCPKTAWALGVISIHEIDTTLRYVVRQNSLNSCTLTLRAELMMVKMTAMFNTSASIFSLSSVLSIPWVSSFRLLVFSITWVRKSMWDICFANKRQ